MVEKGKGSDKKEEKREVVQVGEEVGSAGDSSDQQKECADPLKLVKKTKQKQYLKALEDCAGAIVQASERSGIATNSHYLWLSSDDNYKRAFETIKGRAIETYEDELKRRAIDGVEEPQFYKGEQVGTVRKKSDLLLMFAMKKLDPSYRDNQAGQQIGIWGSDGANIAIQFNIPRPEREQKGS